MRVLIIVFLIAILGISIFLNVDQYIKRNAAEKRISVLSNKQSAIIKTYIAKDSTEHIVYKPIYAKSDAEKELAISKSYIDSLKKALNIKSSQIIEVTRIRATAIGTVKTIAVSDSIGNNIFTYRGKWLNFNVNTKDSIASYAYNLEMKSTRYNKGWFLWKKQLTDLSFADTSLRINGLDYFTIPPERKKRIGLGFQAGYYFDPSQQRFFPAIGVGISYNLTQF